MSGPAIVAYAPDSDFPIQNLPYGVFSRRGAAARHIGVAIGKPFFSFFFSLTRFFAGDQVLDLTAASEAGLFKSELLTRALFTHVRIRKQQQRRSTERFRFRRARSTR